MRRTTLWVIALALLVAPATTRAALYIVPESKVVAPDTDSYFDVYLQVDAGGLPTEAASGLKGYSLNLTMDTASGFSFLYPTGYFTDKNSSTYVLNSANAIVPPSDVNTLTATTQTAGEILFDVQANNAHTIDANGGQTIARIYFHSGSSGAAAVSVFVYEPNTSLSNGEFPVASSIPFIAASGVLSVPEPASLALVGLGALGLGVAGLRRRRAA